MKRGDIVTIANSGDYGKPRPAVIVQSDLMSATDSVLVAPFTSTLREAPLYRIDIEPSAGNGLNLPSQIMVEKILPIPRRKCGPVIGRIDQAALTSLTYLIAVILETGTTRG